MAERFRFTERALKAKKCPSGQERVDVFDDNPGRPNFGLRISRKGRKYFFMLYWFDGRKRRMKLGRGDFPGEVDLKEAVAAYHDARRALKEGRDPKQSQEEAFSANRREAAAEANRTSVAEFGETYLEIHSKPNKRTWREDQRRLKTWIYPYIGHRPLDELAGSELVQILNAMRQKGSHTESNRVRALLSHLFRTAKRQGLIASNPADDLPAAKEEARRVHMEMEEIAFWWESLWTKRRGLVGKHALGLLMVTGQRSGEIRQMRWSEVNWDERQWLIPDTKNGIPHLVPLTELALELLESMRGWHRKHGLETDWVFPSKRGSLPHLGSTALKQANEKVMGDLLEKEAIRFYNRPHDFRTTVTTHMSRLKVPKDVRDRVTNHKDNSVDARHYNLYDFWDEKWDALNRWDEELQRYIGAIKSKT
jgi:integrase